MLKTIEKNPILVLSIVIVLMLLVHLDVPSVTIMEARNFITAREMVHDHNWLLTTMNGEARYQKPPLPTWLSAVSGLLFGINSIFALRLPAALMVLVLGVFLYFLSLKLNLTKLQSFYNALIVITSFYVFAIINEAPWDIYTHGFMLGGIYFLFLLFEERKTVWRNVMLSAFFIGLSILSKGPVSLFAVFLPFLISYGIVFKFKEIKTKIFPIIILLILSVLIGGWWFVYVRLADPAAFLEIASKETGNWASYNVKPFYYYWSFFTQSGIWAIPALISLLYPYMIKRIENKKVYKFSFWWVLIAVILLSLIPEKKPRYLMPVLIPLAINIGIYIDFIIQNFKNLSLKKDIFPVYFNFGLISFISFSLPIALLIILKADVKNHLFNFIALTVACVLIGVNIIKYLRNKNIKVVFYLVILFMISALSLGLPISQSLNKNVAYKSINSLHLIEDSSSIKTYSIGEIAPELLWDYNGTLKDIYKNGQLEVPNETRFGLLIMDEDVPIITSQLNNIYKLELKETYNLNEGSKMKERLIRQFYIISKK
ncbi:glycosyltransferase [Lutibacter sp.]|uniref:ArnT family glycosyltransferase n=1 Tax=Lutibacter sp. TaxID=1925666 RepID=UPI001A303AF3|nr:glycosyltransferase [Lutibacter sp.]MBI9041150.1 glycosyltransferase family 39 protein [Lutibacter sp.]